MTATVAPTPATVRVCSCCNALPGQFYTGLFDSDSMFLPVSLAAIGKYLPGGSSAGTPTGTPTSHRIRYWVQAGTVESGDTDRIGSSSAPMSADVVSRPCWSVTPACRC